jgi:hypothetical protein
MRAPELGSLLEPQMLLSLRPHYQCDHFKVVFWPEAFWGAHPECIPLSFFPEYSNVSGF